MTANAYRGEAELSLGERTWTLRFDWHAMGALRSEFGPEWPSTVAVAIDGMDLPVVAKALEIGLMCHHRGEWTAEAIMDLSPPLGPTTSALNAAIVRAFTGREVPEETTENPLMARLRTLYQQVSALRGRPG